MDMRNNLPVSCRYLAAGSLILAGLQPLAMAQTTRPSAERGPAATETPARSPGKHFGTVTGDRVNVRSGSDRNYYPITQLNMGDQVTVVGEDHGWLEILPPKGTYSLIEKTYVTAEPDSKQGTVNESVWVKAGGEMSSRRYAKQVQLGRGAKVTILGETQDGDFYKIVPPPGATLWISGDFVKLGGGKAEAAGPAAPDLAAVKPGELLNPGQGSSPATGTSEPSPGIVTRATGEGSPVERPEPAPPPPAMELQPQYQIEIKALEAEITAESTKPLQDQNYDSVIERLQKLADQDEDEVAQRYAQARLQQIRSHIDLINTLNQVQELTTSAIAEANAHQRERASINAAEAISLDNIVVQGVLEVSAVYRSADSRPKRWRIVEKPDASQKTSDDEIIAPRTVAYIEVPEGSSIDPMEYVGKRVGIRASKRRYIRDAIPPIPIYTVAQIVPMDRSGGRIAPATRPAGSGVSEPAERERSNRAVVASPESARVAPPSSQPAGAMKPVATDDLISE